MSQVTNVTTPVGRLVLGSLYKGNTTDAEGKPLVVKSGPNMGLPRVDYFFALAIPKGPEKHWAETAWGAEIWKVGHAAFPQAANSSKFAWKITDGDSTEANTKGKRPCDREGYKGHWVLHFSSGFAPNIYKLRDGTRDQYDPFVEPDAVKLGYYVQVNFTCGGNGSQQQPGVFLNHRMVAFSAYGTEIVVGPDVSSAGFGASPLPAGASATPPAGSFGAASGMPPAPPGAAAPAPLIPNPPAPPVAAPAPVVAPAPAAGLQMTPAANGLTYDQYKASGWSDEQMIAAGVAVKAVITPMPPAPAPVAAAPVPPVTPNPAFVAVAPPPVVGLTMTPAANGLTYDQYKASGWNDEQMIAAGVAVRAA